MKKLFFASLWVLACLTAACSDEKDEPNGESGSVVGEWVFQKIAVFREDGTFRYYDFPPEEYYDGTYSYDEASGVLVTDDGIEKQSCRAEITVSEMKWIYDEGNDEMLVEYYTRK